LSKADKPQSATRCLPKQQARGAGEADELLRRDCRAWWNR
jgi:hypothetical protein